MAVTAKDVAEACGVSRITVNRALSGNENVKPETREKILKKAKITMRQWMITMQQS